MIDVATKRIVAELEASGYVGTVSFSRDGRKLLAPHGPPPGPGERGGFRIWDTSDWTVLQTIAFAGMGPLTTGAVDDADFVAVYANAGNIEMRDLDKDAVLWSVSLIEPQFGLVGGDRLLFDRQQLRSVGVAPDGSFSMSYEGQLARTGRFEGAVVVRGAGDGSIRGLYDIFDVTSFAIAPDSKGFAFTSRLDATTDQIVTVRGIPSDRTGQ